MKPQLTVVPLGGLCNRIRVVLSALHLAPSMPIPVVVEWGRDTDCYATFDDLFLPIQGGNFSICDRAWYHHHNTRCNLHLPGLLRHLTYARQHDCFHPQWHGSLRDFVGNHRRVYISSGYSLGTYPVDSINLLRPLPHIAQRIDQIVSKFTSNTIGVHIRRTDHKQAIAHSTDDAFIRALEREIAADIRVKFYLATDDEDLKLQFQERFSQHIIVQPTACCRDTLQGITEAVIDLYALAATRKVLGSFYSSFSDTAADFRGIPLEIVK